MLALTDYPSVSQELSRHEDLDQRFKRLHPHDRQVLQLILQGHKNNTIANRLDVSLRTVENRRRSIHQTLKADSIPEIVQLVLEYEYKLSEIRPLNDWVNLPYVPQRRTRRNSGEGISSFDELRRDQFTQDTCRSFS